MRRQPAAASCPPCISPLQYEADDRASCSGCTCRTVLDNARPSCTPPRLRRASPCLLIVDETPHAYRNSVPIPSRGSLRDPLRLSGSIRPYGRGTAIANTFFFSLSLLRSLLTPTRSAESRWEARARARVAPRWTEIIVHPVSTPARAVVAGEKNCDTRRRRRIGVSRPDQQ